MGFMISPVTIRPATRRDREAIARIAGRDTRPVPAEPVLLAEQNGTPLVAMSMRSGEVVADPFAPTAELVELVRLAGGSS